MRVARECWKIPELIIFNIDVKGDRILLFCRVGYRECDKLNVGIDQLSVSDCLD